MKKIFVVDNYDSFTYNLVHILRDLNCNLKVKRNDDFNLDEINGYDYILLSPGPGIPKESGLLNEVIKKYHKTKNILGVCLGMQAIGEVFGGEIENLKNVYHGVETSIKIIDHEKLFLDIPKNIMVGRYHSWVVKHPLPICLEATSFDKKGHLMSLRHKNYKVYGVQFHPESILTKYGKKILQNWIND